MDMATIDLTSMKWRLSEADSLEAMRQHRGVTTRRDRFGATSCVTQVFALAGAEVDVRRRVGSVNRAGIVGELLV
jgi:hypothetical protein